MCALHPVRVQEPARYSWGWGCSSRGCFLLSLPPLYIIYLPFILSTSPLYFAFVSVSAGEQLLPSDAVPMRLFLLQELFWVCSHAI